MSRIKAAKAISGYFKKSDEPEARDTAVVVEDDEETFAQRVARKLKKRRADQTDVPADVNARY